MSKSEIKFDLISNGKIGPKYF